MSHKDYIKNLINLQDNTLEITDVDLVDEDNIKYFNISIVRNKQFLPKCCKYCGSISIISHGSTSRKIKYLPFANISSNIIYTQKRFLCKVIKRVGFGYKNFDLFRARVLYISNNKKDKNNEKIK